jgi:type IV secretion system protein VirD4
MLDEFRARPPRLLRVRAGLHGGYGLKSFLIAQSLNQIEKAYGPNNSILDNCHVRVSFATNDERRQAGLDALGTATEMKAMKNYAGHRLSPWLGHLMVSRSETARRCSRRARSCSSRRPTRSSWSPHAADPREEGALLRGCLQERILPPPGWRSLPRVGRRWSTLPIPRARRCQSARHRRAMRR